MALVYLLDLAGRPPSCFWLQLGKSPCAVWATARCLLRQRQEDILPSSGQCAPRARGGRPGRTTGGLWARLTVSRAGAWEQCCSGPGMWPTCRRGGVWFTRAHGCRNHLTWSVAEGTLGGDMKMARDKA